MKACIVKPHYAGLFSLINNVVTCLSLYDAVQVDWSKDCIYGNAWPAIFDSHGFTPNPEYFTEGVDVINQYPHQALTYKNAGLLYLAENLLGWRREVHSHWRKIEVRQEVIQRAHKFIYNNLGGRYAAVLVRGNTHAGEQLSDKSQTPDDYRHALRGCGIDRSYIMSGDKESLGWFCGRGFNAISHPDTRRAEGRETQIHLDGGQTIEDAIQCFVEVFILSRASVLIHPVSNMATAALYMNPELHSIYLP